MKKALERNPTRACCPVTPRSATNAGWAMSTEMFVLSSWLTMTKTIRVGATSHHRASVRFAAAVTVGMELNGNHQKARDLQAIVDHDLFLKLRAAGDEYHLGPVLAYIEDFRFFVLE